MLNETFSVIFKHCVCFSKSQTFFLNKDLTLSKAAAMDLAFRSVFAPSGLRDTTELTESCLVSPFLDINSKCLSTPPETPFGRFLQLENNEN